MRTTWLVCPVSVVLVAAQCGTASVDPAARARGAGAFATVYRVLQHPRCVNCHPAGGAPLQGDDSQVHRQSVIGGAEGKGVFGMRCATCHFELPIDGANLPPGAPNWHLPHPRMPLVFEGRGPAQLARQLDDPAQNRRRRSSSTSRTTLSSLGAGSPAKGARPWPCPTRSSSRR